MKYSFLRASTALIISVAFLAPSFAAAQQTDVSSQIQTLLGQIKALQEQLKQLVQQQAQTNGSSTPGMFGANMDRMGTTTRPGCPNINRDLTVGAHGKDVRDLQSLLSQDPSIFPEATTTGFFGPATKRAMLRFEARFGSSTPGVSGGARIRNIIRDHCGDFMNHGNDRSAGAGDGQEIGDHRPWMMGSTTPPMPQWMGSTTRPMGDIGHGDHNDGQGNNPPPPPPGDHTQNNRDGRQN